MRSFFSVVLMLIVGFTIQLYLRDVTVFIILISMAVGLIISAIEKNDNKEEKK